ncbi:hypothetical protein WME94_26085 [Sorangium sp. So ce429]
MESVNFELLDAMLCGVAAKVFGVEVVSKVRVKRRFVIASQGVAGYKHGTVAIVRI